MNRAIASRHKAKMFKIIEDGGQDVIIRPPAIRAVSTNAADKIFGTSGATETDFGTPVTITAMVHQGKVPGGFSHDPMQSGAEAFGLLQESDLILSLKLEDVIVDSDVPYGRTIIDQAKEIGVAGSTFKVIGTFRSGFAPIGPYILWVGLENMGE